MQLIAIAITAQSSVDIGLLRYSLNGAYATVTKYLGGEEACEIPETINYDGLTYTVNIIGEGAFRSAKVTSVILPETITEIGERAFQTCTNLINIIIPKDLAYIGDSYDFYDNGHGTFYNCSKLRTLIYTGAKPVPGWMATSFTYVPDKKAYSSPKYTINSASVIEMITFHETEFAHPGQSFTPTWTNNVDGWNATPNFPTLDMSVGSHAVLIPFTFVRGDESFTADVMYRYAVTANRLTVTVNNASRGYGEENPQFTLSYSGFVGNDNETMFTTLPTVQTTATANSKVGDYPITVSGGILPNYTLTYVPGILSVTKAPLTAKVADTTRVYGANNPGFKIEYIGLKNGETEPTWTTKPTIKTDATKASPAGQYAITTTEGVPVNYQLGSIANGTLSIKPAPLTVKVNNATRQYYAENPEFGYTCTGFVNGDEVSSLSPAPELSTTALLGSPVGQYKIEAKNAVNPNYDIAYVDGTLTVTQRTLQAGVGNYTRLYNEDNPEFEVTYNGFMGDDDEQVLTTKPVAATTATKTSNVGSYNINVSGGVAENYKFSYSSGKLTINKAEQNITWEQDLSSLSVDNQVELKAMASSELPVTYTIESGKNFAELYTSGSKTYMDCKAEGTVQITAIQSGNQNYYSTPKIRNTIKISGKASAVPVTGLTINTKSATLKSIGETLSLVATVLPENASNQDVTWSSTNNDVCIVRNGNVIAVGEGTCVIIATTVEGNFIATCAIKVDVDATGSGVRGDVSGDGMVDITDVNEVINIMLGKL